MKHDEVKDYSKLTDDELITEIAELRACEDLTKEFHDKAKALTDKYYSKLCKYTYLLGKAEKEHEDRIPR